MRVSRYAFVILLVLRCRSERRRFGRPPPTHKRRPSRRTRGRPAAQRRSQNRHPAAFPRTSSSSTPARRRIRRLTAMSETDDPPRTDDEPRRSGGDVLARVLSYLVAITTILGIPIGLYGYYASQQANRVNRTFDFYKDFRGDGLQKDFSLLVTRWNEKSAQADGFLKSDDFTGLSQLAAVALANRRNADCAVAAGSVLRRSLFVCRQVVVR